MIFRQITHDDLGCASYLVGDEDEGVAAVVDPKLDIEEYLALSRYMGVRIEHILETHNHADHVSGHGRLAAATGATIHVHRDAAPEYHHEPFDDGWVLDLGAVRVRALHTPGHRPEHTAFALIDTARGPEPWAVLIAHNELLAERDADAFVASAIGALAPQPPNFQAIVALNRGPLHSDHLDVGPLTARQVELMQAEGGLVVDVRTDSQFDEAHIPAAVCNPATRAGFGTKLAWVADRDHPVILVGRDDEDAIRAAHLAAAVGVTNLGGYLSGGMTSWREDKRPTEAIERLDVGALRDRIDQLQVLDVRERSEWDEGHAASGDHLVLGAVP